MATKRARRALRRAHAASSTGSAPPASAVRLATESRSRPSSATTRPRPTISARWQMPATSSKSEEMRRTERPCDRGLRRGAGRSRPWRRHRRRRSAPPGSARGWALPASGPAPPSAGCRPRAWRWPARARAGARRSAGPRCGCMARLGCGAEEARAVGAAGRVEKRFSRTVRLGARLSSPRRLETKPKPVPRPRAGWSAGSCAPSQLDRAGVDRRVAEEGAAERVVAGTAQADEGQDLARAQGEDGGSGTVGDEVAQRRGPGRPPGAAGRGRRPQSGRPMMLRTRAAGVVSATGAARHAAAVAQHGDAVGDAEDLVEPVGDIEDARGRGRRACAGGRAGGPRRARAAPPWARRGPGCRPRRRGAGDRHHRALGRRQLADLGVGLDAAADRLERRRGTAPGLAPGDQAQAARVAGDQGHVLGHRHAVDEAQILVDEADRQPVDAGSSPAGRAGGPRRRPRCARRPGS